MFIYADFEQSGNYVVMTEKGNRREPVYEMVCHMC